MFAKRVTKNIVWSSEEWPKSRLPGPPLPRPPETRTPLLLFDMLKGDPTCINNAGEMLDYIKVLLTRSITVSDDCCMTNTSQESLVYENVAQAEAVKIDEYDPYDSDYLICQTLEVKSSKLGRVTITTPVEKGGWRRAVVLLWDTLEAGRHVSIKWPDGKPKAW